MSLRSLTEQQRRRLDSRIRKLGGDDDHVLAAELAVMLRRYRMTKYAGFTLAELDTRANAVILRREESSHTMYGGSPTMPTHVWEHGQRRFMLYTYSQQRVLDFVVQARGTVVPGEVPWEWAVNFASEREGIQPYVRLYEH